MIFLSWYVIEKLAIESSVTKAETILNPRPIGVDAVVLNNRVVLNSHYSFGVDESFRLLNPLRWLRYLAGGSAGVNQCGVF